MYVAGGGNSPMTRQTRIGFSLRYVYRNLSIMVMGKLEFTSRVETISNFRYYSYEFVRQVLVCLPDMNRYVMRPGAQLGC